MRTRRGWAAVVALLAAAGGVSAGSAAPPGTLFESVVVHPERPTVVEMSSTSVNRVSCSVPITDVVYSEEKGVRVHFIDREAFIKFLVTKKGAQEIFATRPTEFYIVCGGSVYTVIAQPRADVLPAPIRLAPPKVDALRENRSRLGGLPGEMKILALVREVFTGALPASYRVRAVNRSVNLSADLEVVLQRLVEVEGEGLQAKELRVKARPEDPEGVVSIREPLFATNALGPERKAAVAIGKLDLRAGEETRVVVVELRQGD